MRYGGGLHCGKPCGQVVEFSRRNIFQQRFCEGCFMVYDFLDLHLLGFLDKSPKTAFFNRFDGLSCLG